MQTQPIKHKDGSVVTQPTFNALMTELGHLRKFKDKSQIDQNHLQDLIDLVGQIQELLHNTMVAQSIVTQQAVSDRKLSEAGYSYVVHSELKKLNNTVKDMVLEYSSSARKRSAEDLNSGGE